LEFVFQYGSNILSTRINSDDRLRGDALLIGTAYTEYDHELEFTIWSRTNNCAVADILPGQGRKIWGVIYNIPENLIRRETSDIRKALDAIEGECKNYRRKIIRVMYPEGRPFEEDVITYMGKYQKNGIRTSLEYSGYIIRGLREHNIQEEYINYVKNKIVANNPDLEIEIERL